MLATSLPLELQQQIFSLLDSRSFHAARSVCRWWRFASCDVLTLSRQLQKLPIRPALDITQLSPRHLELLFNEAAHNLLFDVGVSPEPDVLEPHRSAYKLPVRPKMAASSDGKRIVTLNDRSVALYDITGSNPQCLLQRQLVDPRESFGEDSWPRASAISNHQLALSSDGRLLAVGLDRTVQIYELSDDSASEMVGPVNKYIHDACGRYITGLTFEQSDCTLRVCLSGNGEVLYLGSPPDNQGSKGDFNHWRGPSGLEHTFADSSLLVLETEIGSRVQYSGLQLLRPFHHGYLFGAQRHGGGVSSRYVLGHARCTPHSETSLSTAEHASVTELASLESFLSSLDYAAQGLNVSTWESMPSAHEHHPKFAMAGNLLTVAERDKKSVRPMPRWTQLFLYRVPSERRMVGILESKGSAGAKRKYSAARIPLCVDTLPGETRDIQFEEAIVSGQAGYKLRVATEETTKVWSVSEV